MTTPDSNTAPAHGGWRLSSTVRHCESQGRTAGEAFGRDEARATTLARLLVRQARQRFQCEDARGTQLLYDHAAGFASETLEALGERLLSATGWSDWLAEVGPAPPPAEVPDYAKNIEIDIEIPQPSIDSLLEVSTGNGEKILLYLRMQKWYQPNLDRILFEEAMRLEREHGTMPMMVPVLLWPAADGPGIKGEFQGIDRDGKKRKLKFDIRRAWEEDYRRALHSVGTLMVGILGRGAKENMAEIVERISELLDIPGVEVRTREAGWITCYWTMGIPCSMEEVKNLLGPKRMAYIESISDYRRTLGQCFQESALIGAPQGTRQGVLGLIRRQGRCLLGHNPEAEAALERWESQERLEALALKVPKATHWEELLAESAEDAGKTT